MIGDAPAAPSDPGYEDTTALLVRRLRAALRLSLVPITLFALFDMDLAREHLAALSALKVAAVAFVIGIDTVLRRLHSRRRVIGLGLATVAVMLALTTASALLVRDPMTTPLINAAVAFGTATLLPWGLAPQVAVVVMALASSVATVAGVTHTFTALMQYPIAGTIIGLGLSIYVAYEFERSRVALARYHADQHRTEAEVRRLNERLETRVAARTTDLEHLNRVLHAQVAERAEAEAELRRSQLALRALIENANDAIWSIDSRRHVTVYNAVVGRRFQEVFGATLRTGRQQEPDTVAFLEAYWRPLYDRGLAGERFTVEHSFDLPEGTRDYLTSFNPIVADGVVTGLAIFSADVTERKRSEAAARQHQAELTHVLRLSTMGEMAAGLAHEINQPLAAIVNYAQGCGRRLRANPRDVDAVLPVIDDIAAEALRAGEIIRRLRSLVRKETPRQDNVDLGAIAAEAIHLVEPDAFQHGVAVHVDTAADLPPVLGDPIQIEQVVLNLLRNAIDAMADVRGRRELHVCIARSAGDGVDLAVRDTGQGMTPVIAERIFDPFFSTKPGGLGMGLSISRSIIEAHQGRLSVARNADGGATFHVILPTAAAALRAATATQ